jgi:protease-4
LQSSVEHAYRVFVNHVAAAREKTFEQVDAVAQGRVWAGVDAEKHGLVDKLGSYGEAVSSAAERAGLAEDQYQLEYIEPSLGWRQALAMQAQLLAARATAALVPERPMFAATRKLFAPLERELTRIARLTDPKQLYYYCACEVE